MPDKTEISEITGKSEKQNDFCPAHQELTDKMNIIHDKVNSIMTVKVVNGVEKVMPLTDIISDIWEATLFLRDKKKIGKIASHYPRLIHNAKKIIVFIAGSIIVMHLFKFQLQPILKWFLNIN